MRSMYAGSSLWLCLTAGVVSVACSAPHANFVELVQDAVGLIENPAALLATFSWEVTLQQVQ